MAGISPSDDLHASGAYRRQAAGVLVRRAIDESDGGGAPCLSDEST